MDGKAKEALKACERVIFQQRHAQPNRADYRWQKRQYGRGTGSPRQFHLNPHHVVAAMIERGVLSKRYGRTAA